ncbi:MAG: hypothetical protein MI924_21190, partial [Chloroflexales bacterium]|nr:hypothetical protein [Chloroflexales bacterium]
MCAVGVEQIQQQYAQGDVVYLLGEKDNDPNHPELERNCQSMLQGRHRLERGTVFYNYVGALYGPTVYDNQSKALAPGVGHTSKGMFQSSQGLQVIVDDLVAVTPTPEPSVTMTFVSSVTTTSVPGPGTQPVVFIFMPGGECRISSWSGAESRA